MARYEDIRRLQKFGALVPMGGADVIDLRRAHPGVPLDFVDFLEEVGSGTVGPAPGSFRVYSGLVAPADVYDSGRAARLGGIWLFGDDFQGYNAGFDLTRDWQVVEVSPTDGSVESLAASFEEYVRQHVVPD